MWSTLDHAKVSEVARLVRPYLPHLLTDERAADFDRRLGELLARQGAGDGTDVELSQMISDEPAVLQWVEDVLEDPRLLPPEWHELDVRAADYQHVGGGNPIQADRYVCPAGNDFIWYRPEVGVPIPECTTHLCRLVRA